MRWVLAFWLLGRAIVLAAFALSDPHGPADALVHWDGAWFRSIAESGYQSAAAGQSNVAFFPLFPLLCVPLVKAGVPFALAGALVANAAMLGALAATYAFVRARVDAVAARWSVAMLALTPLALFTVAVYSESTYLLASALALLAYERERFPAAAAFGALASATRATGMALAAGMLAAGIRDRRPAAILAGALSLAGVAAFALYCAHAFGDPLAFVHAQHAWRGSFGIDWAAWWAIVQQSCAGWKLAGNLVAALAAYAVMRRDRNDAASFAAGALAVGLFAWLWNANALVVVLLAGGLVATIRFRGALGTPAVAYAGFAAIMLLASGTPFSVDRNAYAVLPFVIALALTARRYPALGIPAIVAMTYGLAVDAAAFARWQWVA